MHKTSQEAVSLMADLLPMLAGLKDVDVLVCPPFTALFAVKALLHSDNLLLGAQNLHWQAQGAYTGEVSPAMVAEFCQYVILGHSERRAYFAETNALVSQKAAAALQVGLIPIVCVGETLEDRIQGRAAEFVSRQLLESLEGLTISNGKDLVVAYEPIWAIGTGKTASVTDAVEMNAMVIRPVLSEIFGAAFAQEVRILYGGSVKPENAAEFFAEPEFDGALVGGASLKAADFAAIAHAAS